MLARRQVRVGSAGCAVLSSPGEGDVAMETLRAIANRNITKVTFEGVPDRPGIAAEIFGVLGERGINVELVVSTGSSTARPTSRSPSPATRRSRFATFEALRREVGARGLHRDAQVCLVSLLGHGLQTEPGIAGRMFGALSRAGINIEAISTSMSSVTCMIEERRCATALAALHREFLLG